jgi:hypothetical protein
LEILCKFGPTFTIFPDDRLRFGESIGGGIVRIILIIVAMRRLKDLIRLASSSDVVKLALMCSQFP